MSNKKYYWLKLKEDFFEEDTLQWLEEQEHGTEYCLLYLKLCLKSLKTDGILIRAVGQMLIPYDAKKLAEITRTNIDTVIVAMELFKNIGLVQILENGEIYLPELQNMVGSETNKAQLMRNKREKDKALKEGNNVTTKLPQVTEELPKCYTEKEIEIEKEIDIENRDISSSIGTIEEEQLNSIMKHCQKCNFKLSRKKAAILLETYKDYMKIIKAITKSTTSKNPITDPYSYLLTVLDDMEREKVVNINAVKKEKDLKFNNFPQRQYDYDDLERKLLGWDKDE